MSVLQNLATAIEVLAAARALSQGGVLTGPASSDAAMTLCEEAQARTTCDVSGVYTVVRTYGLQVRAPQLTQAESEQTLALCEALGRQINAMPLPSAGQSGTVQDLHCGAAQSVKADDNGRCMWRMPLWVEVREAQGEIEAIESHQCQIK